MIASCPYCATDIDTETANQCAVCHTPHHRDCWDENCGCAVPACLGGPPIAGDATRPLVVRAREPTLVIEIPEDDADVRAPEGVAVRDARLRAQRRAWIIVAGITGCMVVVAAALALLQ